MEELFVETVMVMNFVLGGCLIIGTLIYGVCQAVDKRTVSSKFNGLEELLENDHENI